MVPWLTGIDIRILANTLSPQLLGRLKLLEFCEYSLNSIKLKFGIVNY